MRSAPYVLRLAQTDSPAGTGPRRKLKPRRMPVSLAPTFKAFQPDGNVRNECPLVYEVGPEDDVNWLWPNRIPRGHVTLIEGDAGTGKTFVALDLAARFSRGGAWPDESPTAETTLSEPRPSGSGIERADHDQEDGDLQGESMHDGKAPTPALPANGEGVKTPMLAASATEGSDVLFASVQDDDSTIARRLKGLGADLARIRQMGCVATVNAADNSVEQRRVEFPFDLPIIRQQLLEHPAIGLVVIDPLSDFCHSPQRLAETLYELNQLAEAHRVAIVVTLPATSRFDAQGNLRVTSRWKTDTARCVWCVAADPDDPARRLFIPRRTNFCEEPFGLPFRLHHGEVIWNVDEPLDPADPLGHFQAIQSYLNDALCNGWLEADEIFRRGGQCGFSPKHLRTAAKRLKIVSRKSSGYGKDGAWFWMTAAHWAEYLAARKRVEEMNARAAAGMPHGDPLRPATHTAEFSTIERPQSRPESTIGDIPVIRRASDIEAERQASQRAPARPVTGSGPNRVSHPLAPVTGVAHCSNSVPPSTKIQESLNKTNKASAGVVAGKPAATNGAPAQEDAKNRESLEKQADFQRSPHADLARNRYTRRQERKRRQREAQGV